MKTSEAATSFLTVIPTPSTVIPAKAGIQLWALEFGAKLAPCRRRGDGVWVVSLAEMTELR